MNKPRGLSDKVNLRIANNLLPNNFLLVKPQRSPQFSFEGHFASMSNLYEIEFYNSDDPEQAEENESTPVEKLMIAKRTNESLRSLIQDKEGIIENLIFRYGVIQNEDTKGGFVSSDEIDNEQLRRKAAALAQRTILENLELREMVNELREENYNLRNEIYDLVYFSMITFIILINIISYYDYPFVAR